MFFSFLKNMSITARILLVVLIPTISFLFAAGIGIFESKNNQDRLSGLMSSRETSQVTGDLIKNLQEERKNYRNYLSSGEDEAKSSILNLRESNGNMLDKIKNSPHLLQFDRKLLQNSEKSLRSFWQDTAELPSDIEMNVISDKYSEIITSFLVFKSSTSSFVSSKISSAMISLLMIEETSEQALLLGNNLRVILESDLPIEQNMIHYLLDEMATIRSNLNSRALAVTEDTQKTIEEMQLGESWTQINEIFQAVLSLANDGGYGYDPEDTTESVAKVIADINAIIGLQENYILKLFEVEKASATEAFWAELRNVMINCLVIILLLIPLLKNIKANLLEVSQKIFDMSFGISNASSMLNQNSEKLNDGNLRAESAITQTLQTMKNLAEIVDEGLEKSKLTKNSASNVKEKTTQASDVVAKLESSMKEIQNSNEKLQEIVKIMNDISNQTNEVNDIVFQTKLLSFNAAIEAETAGEAGRGFAVVASEVGHLAKKSGVSAESISNLLAKSNITIKDILQEVSESVENGIEISNHVASIISQIETEIFDIDKIAQEALVAGQKQSVGIKEINSAIEDIDATTRSNNLQSGQIEHSATDLSSQSKELQDVSDGLSKMVSGAA